MKLTSLMEPPAKVGCRRYAIRTPTELPTKWTVIFYGFSQINAGQF